MMAKGCIAEAIYAHMDATAPGTALAPERVADLALAALRDAGYAVVPTEILRARRRHCRELQHNVDRLRFMLEHT